MSFPTGRASRHVRCLTCSVDDNSCKAAPEPWLKCSRCRGTTRFRASGRIRVNANGKRVDAWLIYRVRVLRQAWNSPDAESGRHVPTIDAASRVAAGERPGSCPAGWRSRSGGEASSRWSTSMTRRCARKSCSRGGPASRLEIVCVVRVTGVRVDRLVATERAYRAAAFRVCRMPAHLWRAWVGLRRSSRDGLRVRVELRGVHDGEVALAATGREATKAIFIGIALLAVGGCAGKTPPEAARVPWHRGDRCAGHRRLLAQGPDQPAAPGARGQDGRSRRQPDRRP